MASSVRRRLGSARRGCGEKGEGGQAGARPRAAPRPSPWQRAPLTWARLPPPLALGPRRKRRSAQARPRPASAPARPGPAHAPARSQPQPRPGPGAGPAAVGVRSVSQMLYWKSTKWFPRRGTERAPARPPARAQPGRGPGPRARRGPAAPAPRGLLLAVSRLSPRWWPGRAPPGPCTRGR